MAQYATTAALIASGDLPSNRILAWMDNELPTGTNSSRQNAAWTQGQADATNNIDGSPRYGFWYPNLTTPAHAMYADADYEFIRSPSSAFSGECYARTKITDAYASLNPAHAAQLWRRYDQAGNPLPFDLWMSCRIRFPQEISMDHFDVGTSTSGFTNQIQWYGLGGHFGPLLGLGAARDLTNDTFFQWHFNLDNSANFDLPKLTNPEVPVGEWIHIEARAVLSTGTNGSWEVWIDGTKVLNYTGATHVDPTTIMGISWGNYGHLLYPSTVLVDFDEMLISTVATRPNLILPGNAPVTADSGITTTTSWGTGTTLLDTIRAVDGAGSGLDADLLDGHQATDFATASDIGALPWKPPVLVATTGPITLSGVQVVDGPTTPGTGERVLVKNQVDPTENGIWLASTTGAWVRSPDADTGADLTAATVMVRTGTTQADTYWRVTNDPNVVGLDPITWTPFPTGGGGGATNLSFTRTATTLTIASDTGTDAVLPIADTSAGLMSAADRSTLDALSPAAGATGNVQYRDAAGDLAAEAAFTYDAATDQLTVPGLTVAQDLALTGVITPAQITADVNDYNPAGLATAAVVRIAGNAANRALTGLAAQANGTTLVLQNVGPVQLALRAESTASTAANRFALTRDIYLLPNNTVAVRYDSTTARWVLIGGPYTRNTIVSVRDFGAVGDGVANDTAAIQAAINSLATTGGMVWFPEGTYAVSAPINVQTNGLLLFGVGVSDMLATAAGSTVSTGRGSIIRAMSTWAGAGATAAMVRFTSTNGDGRPLLGGGMSSLHVCGWRFSTTPPAGTVHGIYARVARGLFDNVMASECSGRGIWMEGASTANGDTVNWDTYDTVMSRSQFCWNGQDGLYVSEFGGNDLHIDHCIVFNNTLSGLRLRGSSAQVSSLHAYDNTQHGVHIENVRTWIANSKIEGNGRHGLYAQSVAANGRFWGGLNVQGCGFRGNSASAANTYDQMIVEADGGDGPWIVNGNRFSGEQNTPRYGLNISSANPNQGNVTGNTFAGTFGTAPIRRDGPTSVQFMNRITANKGIESFEDFLLLTPNGPGAPLPAGMGALWAGVVANRVLPRYEGPAGIETFLQPFLARNKIGYWCPPGNATTAPGVLGYTAVTVTGTATARNIATTNFFTRMRRLGYVSSATAGSLAGARVGAAQVTRGSGTQFGFTKICRFGISDAAAVAGARMFIGVSSSTGAPTNVEPSTLTNVIGIGHGAADTTFRIYHAGSATQPPIDLGANFPCSTRNTDAYELAIFCPPDGTVHWQVTRLNTGDTASGTITPTATNVPTATTLLTYQQAWRSNNATALAVGIDIMSDYVETDD